MLSQAALKSGLAQLTPTTSEATGIDRFATAFKTYFEDATVDGVSVVPAALAGADTALRAALVGISAGGASTKIQAALAAWWVAVSASAAAIWPGHSPPVLSATVPPTLATLATALEAVFAANLAARAELADAADAIATAMHAATIGGVAPVGPPAASFPIL